MAVTALPTPEEEPGQTIVFDPNTLTMGELEEIEDLTGRNVSVELGRGQPSAKTLTALVYVFMRRDDPAFTMDDARATKVDGFRVESTSDPKEPAG